VARDAPRDSGNYRNEEWVAFGIEPGVVDKIVQREARGRFAICEIHPVGEADVMMRQEYKSLGYRLQTTEPLMIHSLQKIPRFAPPAGVEIQRVRRQELADRLAKVARARQIFPHHFEDEEVRQYIAMDGERIVGWVRSVDARKSRWCSNMHVLSEYRRRGIARAMLSQMLRDDRDNGCKANVLTASHVGAKLYPAVGYQHLATLYVYKFRRK